MKSFLLCQRGCDYQRVAAYEMDVNRLTDAA